MKSMIDGMVCEGDAQLQAALTRGGPLMLAGLHFGNLMLFVTKLRFMIPDDRKLMVILHRDAPGAFFDDALRLVAEYGAGEVEFIDIEERVHLRRLITSLRREAPVFLLFSDLHGKFGKTNRCRLGGRWVRMAGGGVKLAVEQGIPLLVSYATGVPFRDRCAVHFTGSRPARSRRCSARTTTRRPCARRTSASSTGSSRRSCASPSSGISGNTSRLT